MNKKTTTVRKSREPEHHHMMFDSLLGIIVGFVSIHLYIIRIFVDYDLSYITDLIYVFSAMLCILLGFFTRYLIHELEHITELYHNSKRYNMTEKGADQMPSSEESRIQ